MFSLSPACLKQACKHSQCIVGANREIEGCGNQKKSFENQVMMELVGQLPSRKDRFPCTPLAFGIKGGWRRRPGRLPGSEQSGAQRPGRPCCLSPGEVAPVSSGHRGRGDAASGAAAAAPPGGAAGQTAAACGSGLRFVLQCVSFISVLSTVGTEKMPVSTGSSRKAHDEFFPSESSLFYTGVFIVAEPRVQSRVCLWLSGRMARVSLTFCSPCEGDTKFPLI